MLPLFGALGGLQTEIFKNQSAITAYLKWRVLSRKSTCFVFFNHINRYFNCKVLIIIYITRGDFSADALKSAILNLVHVRNSILIMQS